MIVAHSRRRQLVTGPLVAVLGWTVVALVVVAALGAEGHRLGGLLTFAFVWLVSTTVPGILVWRALCRPTSVIQEVGFGSVLGIGLLLLAWLPSTLLGQPLLMWLWPLGVAIVFGAVPSLRTHLRPRRDDQRRVPLRWQLSMMAVVVLGFLRLWAIAFRQTGLPPGRSTVFQDFWYEIGLTARLGHGVAIDDPAVAGVPLRYHWFSNAHAAAVQQLSGSTASEVVMHLWPTAMLVTFVLAVAAAAERLLQGAGEPSAAETSRRWWVGPLAALVVAALPVTSYLGWPPAQGVDNGFVVSSTSGMLALTIILALVGPVLDLLHGRGGRGTWVLLGLLLVLSVGSKPSILPVVACGAALTAVVQWAQTRTFPRVAATLALVSLLLIPVSAVALIGSTGGSRIQLFDILLLDPAYDAATDGSTNLPGYGGWLVPGLAGGSVPVWGVALGVLAIYTLTELPRLLGTVGVLARGDRTLAADPGTWWCSGVVASGFCGLWVLAHPAYSQHYFWRITIGLGVVLTVTTAVRLVPPQLGWRDVRPDLLAFGAGGLAVGLVALQVRSPDESIGRRLLPYAAAIAVCALLLAARRLLRPRARTVQRVPALVLVTVFVVVASAPVTWRGYTDVVRPAVTGGPPIQGSIERRVSTGEQTAALWLQQHSGVDDVVATNVFCAPSPYQPGCRHVAFWVAALTERRLYYGAWAYTAESLTAYPQTGTDYQRGPAPRPERLGLSLEAIGSPSPAVIDRLRREGVRWIFADRLATPISPDLDRLATLAYENADVSVYRLDG